ncbi:phosphoribosyltransferase-like protein [Chytriomyces sp. MP71]|nr:phosphoribosyltransferase-like protein [Chytriomyces sp. MP71]
MNRFVDRVHAGKILAQVIMQQRASLGVAEQVSKSIVLALPRGGVPVAVPIAEALGAPLDLLLVRKLGIPGHEEVAMGAISVGGVEYLNRDLIARIGIPTAAVARVRATETAELARRNQKYRDGRAPPDVRGKTVYVVDDGIATGATMRAAILALKTMQPHKIIAVAPVGAQDTVQEVGEVADEVVVMLQPHDFQSVGLWYRTFDQTEDEEVLALLAKMQNRNLNAA